MDPIPVPVESAPDTVAAAPQGDALASQGNGDTVVDVMVVYTPAAKAQYGGVDGIKAVIMLAVEETNQAYLNSGVDARLNLVHAAEVAYTESASYSTDLNNLTGTGDGYMDEVHALRDAYGADLVSLFQATGGYCGLSWQMSRLTAAYSVYAFSVVYTECATGYYSFGHELGHNMGSAHDHASGGSGLFAYSYGYQDTSRAFRTIMAYDCSGGCTRVQHFSNPYVTYAGLPTGVADYADNVSSLNGAIPLVATWRESVVAEPPAMPSQLSAMAVSYEQVELSWTDNATDESGFRVERSDNGVDFAEIASLAADSTAFSDTGLAADTTYYYRVSAYSGAGTSGYSNDAWATTLSAPLLPPLAPSNLAAAAVSHTEVALSWSDNTSDETGYEVERRVGSLSWMSVASLAGDSTGYHDQALSPSSTYSYRLRAIGDGGISSYSNTATVTTQAEPISPPATPSNLSATAQSDSAIQLSWADNATNETGYEIERSVNGGQSWSSVASLGLNTVAYTNGGLNGGTYYLYRVRATGEGGPSGYSNEAGATTEAPAAVCEATGSTSLVLGNTSADWTLTNSGTVTLTIQRIDITWPSSQGNLSQISLSGSRIWRGSDSPTTAIISSGWGVGTSGLQIAQGATAKLGLTFSRRDKTDSQSDYSIAVTFSEGCSVELVQSDSLASAGKVNGRR
jgi:fibronectin type 3 domain-containing protein